MNKKIMFVVLVLGMLLPTVAAQSSVDSVCLISDVGRVNDGTFNQFAYEGMVQAAEDFDLDSTYIETQSQTDYADNIATCLQEDFDIIITVGYLLRDATIEAAFANPSKYFIGVDQDAEELIAMDEEVPLNYVGVQAREDEAGFLVGVLAAQVTQSGVVAGVYGVDIPPVVKFRLGFEQGVAFGAALAGKDVTALGVYIDDFEAPDRGASAANQFIGDGADVIFGAGGQTGSGGITEAAQQGVWVIGVDQDEYNTTFGGGETPGAEYIISSSIKRVDVGVYDMVAALVAGDMEAFPGGGNYLLSIANEGIGFTEKHDAELDDSFYELTAVVQELIVSGELETGVDIIALEITASGAELYEAVAELLMAE